MGTVDLNVRVVFAVVLATLCCPRSFSGIAAMIIGFIAIIMLLTRVTEVCPLYRPLGISTMKKEGK